MSRTLTNTRTVDVRPSGNIKNTHSTEQNIRILKSFFYTLPYFMQIFFLHNIYLMRILFAHTVSHIIIFLLLFVALFLKTSIRTMGRYESRIGL